MTELKTKQEFDAALATAAASNKLVVVDFTATWYSKIFAIAAKSEFIYVKVPKNLSKCQISQVRAVSAGGAAFWTAGANPPGRRFLQGSKFYMIFIILFWSYSKIFENPAEINYFYVQLTHPGGCGPEQWDFQQMRRSGDAHVPALQGWEEGKHVGKFAWMRKR